MLHCIQLGWRIVFLFLLDQIFNFDLNGKKFSPLGSFIWACSPHKINHGAPEPEFSFGLPISFTGFTLRIKLSIPEWITLDGKNPAVDTKKIEQFQKCSVGADFSRFLRWL